MRDPFVLLADLVHPNNQLKTFPYAAACVGAHAQAHCGGGLEVDVHCEVEALSAAFDRRPPAVVGLTNYVWNLELGYEVVRRVKAAAPRTVVVMGGPNYPGDADGQAAFLRRYPLIDFYVFKEGELPFLALLERLRAADWDADALKREDLGLSAVHYLSGSELVAPPPAPRVRELDDFASPYLHGLLDRFLGSADLAPVIQTKRGCPFECTFCVEGERYYTKLASVSTERVRAELEYIAPRMRGGAPVLYIADSNFGMYEHDLELCDVITAVRERHGWPQTIDVSTGKNRKERVLEAVRRTRGAMRFGPALQSTDKQTLANVKRSNISEAALIDMASAALDSDQRSYTELILGLPGDTAAAHLRSIRAAMDAGLQRIKMYPLVLLPGTEMASAASRQQFGLETRFRVLPQSHGTHHWLGTPFPGVEVVELVVGTAAMSFDDYLACRRFELSVEIFYNDLYLEEIHGLMRGLGLPMFDLVERCHARLDRFPEPLRALYAALDRGLRDNLWDSRDACLAHFRDAANLERYARDEYTTSLGTLKALALLEHIEAILAMVREALHEALAAAGRDRGELREYVDELLEYSRLRRLRLFDSAVEPEGSFRFAFDRIGERGFRVDPLDFRLEQRRTMRFSHDPAQARDIRALCAAAPSPALRARSFIYPRTDPGSNPYLRHARFR